MSFGMVVKNASGVTIIDENSKLARVLGTVYVPQTNGSLTDAGFATGVPFGAVVVADTLFGSKPGAPTVTFSGNTMSWSYPYSSMKSNVYIIYGVY